MNTRKISSKLAQDILASRIAERIAGMCEQRSHLPGDIGWTTQSPDEERDIKEKEKPSDCTQCRRTWASRRKKATSSVPGGNQEDNSSDWKGTLCSASSIVPGDAYQLSEQMDPSVLHNQNEDINGVFNRDRMSAEEKPPYRYDPHHEEKPTGPGWHKTDKGWSQAEESKEEPKPAQSVVQQPTQKPAVQQHTPMTTRIHFKDEELAHRVMLPKKEDLIKVLNEGHYSVISAGKNGSSSEEENMSPTDPKFHERTLQLRDDLEKAGVPYTEVIGVYDSQEPSFMVLHDHDEPFTEKTAREFMVHHKDKSDRKTISILNRLGEKYNQDSVLHVSQGKNTVVFTTGKNKGKHCGNRGWEEIPDAINYYTDIPVKDKSHTKIQVNIKRCFELGYLKASMNLLKIAREILGGDQSPYRHDPKHHHRPLGGKWRRTDDGWSQLPADAKPGPVPEKKVEHKPGTEGVKQVDTQTQNG